MQKEIHICGIALHVHPQTMKEVVAGIAAIPGTQLHAETPDGRLIITLETETTAQTLDRMDDLRSLRGVLNVVLVYQHAEPANSLDEELEI
jgi:periplasmic nitrate reductase NapD